eukprot:Amastigsp_a182818_2.p3 type:complete len:103 gc:universal Amastigsp_a182818_2:356-48(-)
MPLRRSAASSAWISDVNAAVMSRSAGDPESPGCSLKSTWSPSWRKCVRDVSACTHWSWNTTVRNCCEPDNRRTNHEHRGNGSSTSTKNQPAGAAARAPSTTR